MARLQALYSAEFFQIILFGFLLKVTYVPVPPIPSVYLQGSLQGPQQGPELCPQLIQLTVFRAVQVILYL